MIYVLLVGGLWNILFIFPFLVGMMIQSDEIIFFRGVDIPPMIYGFMLTIQSSASDGGLLAFELQPWCSAVLGLDTSQGMLEVMEVQLVVGEK